MHSYLNAGFVVVCRIKIAIKDLAPGEQQDMWLDFDNPKEEVCRLRSAYLHAKDNSCLLSYNTCTSAARQWPSNHIHLQLEHAEVLSISVIVLPFCSLCDHTT